MYLHLGFCLVNNPILITFYCCQTCNWTNKQKETPTENEILRNQMPQTGVHAATQEKMKLIHQVDNLTSTHELIALLPSGDNRCMRINYTLHTSIPHSLLQFIIYLRLHANFHENLCLYMYCPVVEKCLQDKLQAIML